MRLEWFWIVQICKFGINDGIFETISSTPIEHGQRFQKLSLGPFIRNFLQISCSPNSSIQILNKIFQKNLILLPPAPSSKVYRPPPPSHKTNNPNMGQVNAIRSKKYGKIRQGPRSRPPRGLLKIPKAIRNFKRFQGHGLSLQLQEIN